VKKKQKRNDDDANDVFDVVDDFNAANKIENNDDDNEFAKNERDVNETSKTMNDDEIVRHEINDDENSFCDVFRDRDSAFNKRKRI
jgi:hypothetical protein